MHFEQTSESGPTTITYDIKGNDSDAERGMHVHQFGDNTNGCTSAGPHCMSTKVSCLSLVDLIGAGFIEIEIPTTVDGNGCRE